MTVPAAAAAARFDAQQRAVTLLTSFTMSIERDDIDGETGEIMFDVLTELRTQYDNATDCVERQAAWEAMERTVVALLGIVHALIEHLDTDASMYEVLQAIAHACEEYS